MTIHIFSLFEDKSETGDLFRSIPFKVCLDAELVEPAVHTYRDKLNHLQLLEFDAAKFSQVNLEELKQVKFLCLPLAVDLVWRYFFTYNFLYSTLLLFFGVKFNECGGYNSGKKSF